MLLLILAKLSQRQWSLSKESSCRFGLLGVVFGLALHAFYDAHDPIIKESILWFNIVGTRLCTTITNDHYAIGICFYF